MTTSSTALLVMDVQAGIVQRFADESEKLLAALAPSPDGWNVESLARG